MPTWKIRIERQSVQRRGSRARTVGTYRIFHDDEEIAEFGGVPLIGMTAEARGPGDNSVLDNGKRVEPGRYPLWTQAGGKYVTHDYRDSENPRIKPKPGIELKDTGKRKEILIHPGVGFLAAVGCINLCTRLPDAGEDISFPGSRRRVIAAIEDMKKFLGAGFPASNGLRMPGAFAVIQGEP